MKTLQIVLFFIIALSCKNKEVEQEIPNETSCFLTSYTNSAGFAYKLKYDSEKVSEWTISYTNDFFSDSVTSSYNIIYNSLGSPSYVTQKSSNKITAKFFYDSKGALISRIAYVNEIFPTFKKYFEWNNGMLSRIRTSQFVVRGQSDDLNSYVEIPGFYYDLTFDEIGNLTNQKAYNSEGIFIAEIHYEYDSNPNPFRDLSMLMGDFSKENIHMLSTNNLVKSTYIFPGMSPQEYTFALSCNSKGYPDSGFQGSTQIIDMKYDCK